MKIAYLHYHLKTGGVTTVIKQQVGAVTDDCDTLVISGARPETEPPFDVRVVKGADYSSEGYVDPIAVADGIINTIRSKWPDGCDVLHVHNPLLAKNIHFLRILTILREKGVRLFLHIHDFAEDGRPLAYFKEEYPSDCHYGVINSRDYHILLGSGLQADGLHCLFNMVKTLDPGPPTEHGDNYILYPVRAIRRKNIGEAILVSLFLKNKEKLMVTLPPNSEQDIRSHQGWKRFVSENNLNVELDASLRHDFMDLVSGAEFILTTSITEGFGFSFSEPWTAGKPLWGRKLPDICSDFEKNGMVFPGFYLNLFLPVAWVGKGAFFERWASCIRKNLALFGVTKNEFNIDASFEAMTSNGYIDFGILDEQFQKKIIMKIISDPDAFSEMKHINPFLVDLDPTVPDSVITGNSNAVRRHYSMDVYRKILLQTYEKIVKTTVRHAIDKKKLMSGFMNSQTLSLLKWGEYGDSSDD